MFRILLGILLFFSHLFAQDELSDSILPLLDPSIKIEFYQTLQIVDRLFSDKGIKYWVTAGSLLGAIRHGEMIPWDDDIDIALFIHDLGAVISMRPELERQGLTLLINCDYAKIFPTKGKKINHPDGGYYPHRYPFIDLFFMQRSGRRIVHASDRLKEGFEQDWLEGELVLTRKPFGPLFIPVPDSARAYLERMYGEDCWEWAYADYDHSAEQKRSPIKVKLINNPGMPRKVY
jgi:hypothetical protein